MQSNSYSSTSGIGAPVTSSIQYESSTNSTNRETGNGATPENRPGSRLKANIDELDTLLSDLNNAQTHRTATSHHETSSEDYGEQTSPHLVKLTLNP